MLTVSQLPSDSQHIYIPTISWDTRPDPRFILAPGGYSAVLRNRCHQDLCGCTKLFREYTFIKSVLPTCIPGMNPKVIISSTAHKTISGIKHEWHKSIRASWRFEIDWSLVQDYVRHGSQDVSPTVRDTTMDPPRLAPGKPPKRFGTIVAKEHAYKRIHLPMQGRTWGWR
jgi:hypothetical protein